MVGEHPVWVRTSAGSSGADRASGPTAANAASLCMSVAPMWSPEQHKCINDMWVKPHASCTHSLMTGHCTRSNADLGSETPGCRLGLQQTSSLRGKPLPRYCAHAPARFGMSVCPCAVAAADLLPYAAGAGTEILVTSQIVQILPTYTTCSAASTGRGSTSVDINTSCDTSIRSSERHS